eukprot:1158570-Pelagomonas_calceolata.AAC.3
MQTGSCQAYGYTPLCGRFLFEVLDLRDWQQSFMQAVSQHALAASFMWLQFPGTPPTAWMRMSKKTVPEKPRPETRMILMRPPLH